MKAQSCTLLGPDRYQLNTSEQNTTAVSKATFGKTHRVVFTGMKPVGQENY